MPERCPCPAPRRHPASGRKKGSGQSGGQPRHFRALSEELRGPSGTPAGGHLDAHPRRPAPPALPANPSRDGGPSACHCCSLRSQFWHFKKLGIAQSIIRLSTYLPIYLSIESGNTRTDRSFRPRKRFSVHFALLQRRRAKGDAEAWATGRSLRAPPILRRRPRYRPPGSVGDEAPGGHHLPLAPHRDGNQGSKRTGFQLNGHQEEKSWEPAAKPETVLEA